jgi:ATP/maltotriose-dependent transcriptional regulator MalT
LFVTVHKRAALWFARNNYFEDAFRHAFASEDYRFASEILEDHLFVLCERYEIASALRWLTKLPHDVLMQHVLLRLYNC